MAVTDITLVQKRNKTVYFVIWDLATDLAWDSADGEFKAIGSAVTQILPATAEPPFQVQKTTYRVAIELDDVHSGPIKSFFAAGYFQQGVEPAPATDKPAGNLQLDIEDGTLRLTEEQLRVIVADIVGDAGSGDVQVDQDYGGQARLCYRVQGVPVDNAEVTFYLLSDYQVGNISSAFIVAASRTRVDGAWVQPVMLDPADYALVFHKQQESGPDAFALGVTNDPALSTLTRISPPPPQATITDDCVVEGLDAFGGNGTILVDQDYGGTNALTWELDGTPVTGAEILIFPAAAYNAGDRQNKDSVAASRQLATGDWQQAVKLDPGEYIIQFFKTDVAGPNTFPLTVS
jgi:hypothetical protein